MKEKIPIIIFRPACEGAMKHQYLKENPDGSRSHVSEWEWEADRRDRKYKQLHAYGVVIIYKMV